MKYYKKLDFYIWIVFVFTAATPILTFSRSIRLLKYLTMLFILMKTTYFAFKDNKFHITILTFFFLSYIPSLLMSATLSFDLFFLNIGDFFTIAFLFYFFSLYRFNGDIIGIVKTSVYIVSLVYVLWGIVQFIFYRMHINLNNVLFLLLAQTADATITDLSSQVFMPQNPFIPYRLTGFAMDPFYLGFFCNYVIFLSKKRLIKLLALFCLIFSFSRSNLLGFCIYLAYKLFSSSRNFKEKYISKPFVCISVPLVILISFVIVFFSQGVGATHNHRIFYFLLPFSIFSENPLLLPFGGSPILTGGIYPFYSYLSEFAYLPKTMSENFAWAIESDWAGIVIGRGFFGIITYLLIFADIVLKKKIPVENKVLAIAVFIGGVGYDILSLNIVILILGIIIFEEKLKRESNLCMSRL